MTRDEARKILGEGATEEQITNFLSTFHSISKKKDDEINLLKGELEKKNDYDEIKSKLDEIEKANMSEQEKIAEKQKEIDKNLAQSRIIVNTAKAKEILAGEDLDDKLISQLVVEDTDVTIALATKMKETLSSLKENVAKKTKEDLSTLDISPTLSNVKQNEDVMTFEKFSEMTAEEQEKFMNEHPEEFEKL